MEWGFRVIDVAFGNDLRPERGGDDQHVYLGLSLSLERRAQTEGWVQSALPIGEVRALPKLGLGTLNHRWTLMFIF
jgi:hypothetical protein